MHVAAVLWNYHNKLPRALFQLHHRAPKLLPMRRDILPKNGKHHHQNQSLSVKRWCNKKSRVATSLTETGTTIKTTTT